MYMSISAADRVVRSLTVTDRAGCRCCGWFCVCVCAYVCRYMCECLGDGQGRLSLLMLFGGVFVGGVRELTYEEKPLLQRLQPEHTCAVTHLQHDVVEGLVDGAQVGPLPECHVVVLLPRLQTWYDRSVSGCVGGGNECMSVCVRGEKGVVVLLPRLLDGGSVWHGRVGERG